uniref:Uncharacterized protein n=1 Tax=Glossina pallidipes TaxID=7398 RepID=A0A1A9Z0G1_GLOPL
MAKNYCICQLLSLEMREGVVSRTADKLSEIDSSKSEQSTLVANTVSLAFLHKEIPLRTMAYKLKNTFITGSKSSGELGNHDMFNAYHKWFCSPMVYFIKSQQAVNYLLLCTHSFNQRSIWCGVDFASLCMWLEPLRSENLSTQTRDDVSLIRVHQICGVLDRFYQIIDNNQLLT